MDFDSWDTTTADVRRRNWAPALLLFGRACCLLMIILTNQHALQLEFRVRIAGCCGTPPLDLSPLIGQSSALCTSPSQCSLSHAQIGAAGCSAVVPVWRAGPWALAMEGSRSRSAVEPAMHRRPKKHLQRQQFFAGPQPRSKSLPVAVDVDRPSSPKENSSVPYVKR